MKRLLFLSYGGGHGKLILQLLRTIRQRYEDKYFVINVGLTTAAPEFKQAGYPVNGFANYIDSDADTAARALGGELAREMHSDTAGISYEESVAYLGLSMQDLIERVGKAEAWRLLRQVGRMAFCPLSVVERIVRRERPDVVITTNSPKSERAALVVARQHGIPSLRIEDLHGKSAFVRYMKAAFPSDAAKIVFSVKPNRVAVMNDVARQNILKRGADEDLLVEAQDVRVTGQPVMDEAVFQGQTLKQCDCRRKLALPDDPPTLVWAADNSIVDELIFQALRRVFAKRPEWFLVVKLHPGFSRAQWESYTLGSLPNMAIMGGGNILEYIAASDAMLTQFTTVGLETIAFGRPLVLIDLGPQAEIFRQNLLLRFSYEATVPYVKPGAAAVVSDLDLLETGVEEILNAREVPPPDKNFLNADGKATLRILHLIDELAAGSG